MKVLEVDATELPSAGASLPKGWVKASFGDLATYINGRAFKPTEWMEEGRPILRIQNLTGSTKTVNRFNGEVDERHIIKTGDLLISWSATLGAYIYKGEEAVLNQHIFKVLPNVDKLFLFYGTFHYIDDLKRKVHGSGMQHITKGKFEETTFWLPPLNEQKRIVEKLETLLSDLDKAVESLKAAQEKLKNYRRAVLKAAVEGELSRAWREENRERLEPASELLERILSERRSRWEEAELAKMREKDKEPKDDKWKEKYQGPAGPDLSELSELPEGWVWASLDQLSWSSSYGTSEKSAYDFEGIPILRIPNIKDGKLSLDDLKFSKGNTEVSDMDALALGDVLIIRTNGSLNLLGRASFVLDNFDSPHYFASYLIRFRVVSSSLSLMYWLNDIWSSTPLRNWVEARGASSAGQHNISMNVLATMPLPLPPESEQTEIHTHIDEAFSVVEKLEESLTLQLKHADQFRQSILKKAFSGELVPQDPNDEPASVLLERIRAEREAAVEAKKGKAGAKAPRKVKETRT